jgi:hypothetical protein
MKNFLFALMVLMGSLQANIVSVSDFAIEKKEMPEDTFECYLDQNENYLFFSLKFIPEFEFANSYVSFNTRNSYRASISLKPVKDYLIYKNRNLCKEIKIYLELRNNDKNVDYTILEEIICDNADQSNKLDTAHFHYFIEESIPNYTITGSNKIEFFEFEDKMPNKGFFRLEYNTPEKEAL